MVNEYRCKHCGHICWTTLSIGCKACSSKALQDFEGPPGYNGRKHELISLSKDLCAFEQRCRTLGSIVDAQIQLVLTRCTWLNELSPSLAEYRASIESALEDYARGAADANIAITRLVTGHIQVCEFDRGLNTLVSAAAESMFGTAIDYGLEVTSQRYEEQRIPADLDRSANAVDNKPTKSIELRPHALQRPSARIYSGEQFRAEFFRQFPEIKGYVTSTLNKHDQESVASNLEHCFSVAAARVTPPQYASEPGVMHMRLTRQYTMSVTDAFWTAIKNAGKALPVIYMFARLELPGCAGLAAAAEVVKAISDNIAKLREDSGEVCVYNAVVIARAVRRCFPTQADILAELKSMASCIDSCRYYDRAASRCTVDAPDVTSILAFLKDRNVLKQPGPGEWWIRF